MQPIAAEATIVPLVSLTFDDGDPSIYTTGFPILNAQGVPASFYYITQWLTEPWKAQLRDLQDHGWEIGSHSVTHANLSTLTPEEVDQELRQSKADLEAAGLTVTGFAYPFGMGANDPAISQAVAQYYSYARSTNTGFNSLPLNTYALYAQTQDSSVSLETMKGWVDTAIATNRWLIILMHQVDDTGGMYSITPANLAGLAGYIKAKVDAGSLRAVTVQQAMDLYTGSTPSCYPLMLSHTGQGSNPTVSPLKSSACSTNGQYVYGETLNLSGAVPSTGWQIGSWTGTNNDSSTASTNTLTMPASARTVSVNYTQIEYSLTITSAHGTVTKNPNKATYHYSDVVQLTASPATGWSFVNWTGDVTSASNPVSVTMNGNKAITANYTQNCYALTLSHTGQGSDPAASPPKSTACSTNGQYVYGAAITLSGAVPGTGWQIGGWTGTVNDSSTSSTNSLSMPASARTVSVNYAQIGYTLTITSAHGAVTKNPDQATYTSGDVVQLTAAPAAGWSFVNWTGDATGTSNPVSVTINGNKAITATYSQIEYTLNITSAHGTVTRNPNKATYHYGDVVQLTAAPAAGWSFANWSGDVTGAGNPVSVTINGDKAVIANYIQFGYTLTIVSTHGTVTKIPDKAAYSLGEVVQLNATADHDWLFMNWTGDVTGPANPISVTMGNNKTITANFVRSGADTAGVFRPSNGLLYLKNRNDTGIADIAINYGLSSDYPVVGDWDGNGTVTIGVYRGGKFYLRNANSVGFADLVFAFGTPGDQPIAGDWNGDGMDTIGVYRSSTATFYLRNSNSGGSVDVSFVLGNPGDVGITGDWNGDGMDTTGVFRPSNGYLFLKNSNTSGIADMGLNYGIPGDKPVTGDWDNNGTDTIGVYRGNTFYLRNDNSVGFADLVFSLGNFGDQPVAGNWDGLP